MLEVILSLQLITQLHNKQHPLTSGKSTPLDRAIGTWFFTILFLNFMLTRHACFGGFGSIVCVKTSFCICKISCFNLNETYKNVTL